MTINFYLKEDKNVGEESMTITLVRNKSYDKTQIINSKRLDDFTAIEQQNLKALVATIEKYSDQEQGAKEIGYNL